MQDHELHTLITHMEWADALIWRTVASSPGCRQDHRLLELLHHLHTVQWVYLQIWRGEAPAARELKEFADLAALAAWVRPYYPEARAFLQGLSRDELSRECRMPWADQVAKRFGSAGSATVAETVLQVVLHSGYHRGQIASRIRELGSDPPLTDFIAWAWQERPAPEWEVLQHDA